MPALAADPTIRRQVMAAAREVLEADPGAAIDAIAQRAGVSRATFYRHFGSRRALLQSVSHEPRPDARSRILVAAQEMLIRSSLSELAMDDLARAALPGKIRYNVPRDTSAALLQGLIETYSPFEAVRAIVIEHRTDAPSVVLPLVARTVVGVAGERLGLLRAVFLEVTSASETALTGMRPVFNTTLGVLAEYMATQMALGRVRPMHPMLALQAFVGPVVFHLLTRPAIERMAELPMTTEQAVDELVAVAIRGLAPA